jgi:hypothetical protein
MGVYSAVIVSQTALLRKELGDVLRPPEFRVIASLATLREMRLYNITPLNACVCQVDHSHRQAVGRDLGPREQ